MCVLQEEASKTLIPLSTLDLHVCPDKTKEGIKRNGKQSSAFTRINLTGTFSDTKKNNGDGNPMAA